jgi:hypothetical protein
MVKNDFSVCSNSTNPCTELVIYRSPRTVLNGFRTDHDSSSTSSSDNDDISENATTSETTYAAAMATSPSVPLTFNSVPALGKTASDADMLDLLDSDDMDL